MDTGLSSHRPHIRGLADVAHPRPGSVSVSTVTELIFVRAQHFALHGTINWISSLFREVQNAFIAKWLSSAPSQEAR